MTSNSTLRGHLEKVHSEEYLRLCKEHGWKIQLPNIMKGAVVDNTKVGLPRSPFSHKIFQKALVDFIVVNDQVRSRLLLNFLLFSSLQAINVVECPEFRNLLLVLRENLEDKDIPRRTKIREAILKEWDPRFQHLKKDLAVCFSLQLCMLMC
jgi:hypothetical protein